MFVFLQLPSLKWNIFTLGLLPAIRRAQISLECFHIFHIFHIYRTKAKKKKIRSRRIPTAHVIYGIPLWLEDICIHLALHLWPNVSLITSHVDTQLFICDWINKIPWLGCGGTLRCVRSNSLLKVEGCRGEKIKKVRRRGEIETHKGQLGCCGRRRIWSRGDLGIHTGRDC